MKVQDMMHTQIVTVSPDTSLAQAQRLMREHHIRHLPVLSNRKFVGLVTDRDLRNALPSQATMLSQGEAHYQLDTTPIETCITRNLVVIEREDEIGHAARRLLEGPFGCLPVVESDELVGIITEIDLLKGFLAATDPEEKGIEIRDYMRTEPYTVKPTDLVSVAYQRMQNYHIRHLPVISEAAELVGILSDRDIRLAGASSDLHLASFEWMQALDRMTVKAIMTPLVQTVHRDMRVAEAGQLLIDHKFGCLPVVNNDGMLEGIVTVTDLIRGYVGNLGRLKRHLKRPISRELKNR